MLSSIRRSFGMSPSASASNIHAEYFEANDASAAVLSSSEKPNTLIPLRRSNSFTRFFSSSRSSSPVKDHTASSPSKIMSSPTKPASSSVHPHTKAEPVLAFLVLMDKKGRPKQRYPIQNLKTTMGRSIENDVRFLVSDVSRLHCTIEIEIQQQQQQQQQEQQQQQDAHANKAFLQVLGANGVLLNGTHVYPAPKASGRYELHTDDSIVIAKRSFIFELATPTSDAAVPSIFSSPVKDAAHSAVAQTPGATSKRRIRMSLVNAAQIDTPAKSRKQASPNKLNDAEREARRANGLQRFMQSANVSPSKAKTSKTSARQSLTSSSVASMFATPVKSRNSAAEPQTAPPKQVSFSLYTSSCSGRLSPVKQMRIAPPLDTMDEEQDASYSSNNGQAAKAPEPEQVEDEEVNSPRDDSSEDIVVVEELEQQPEVDTLSPVESIADPEDKENTPPYTIIAGSPSCGTPGKSDSPKRAKRRSSFFGRAGPFAGMSLGFYAEERKDEPAEELESVQPIEAEEFSDASDAEPAPMDEDEPVEASPIQRPMPSGAMRLGISKTPSPVKKQHFVGLTPMPRRPRLSLNTRRNVSLRTQTLLRSSQPYADRLFLPPPPPSPASPGKSGLSKSMSMPSHLSGIAPMQPSATLDGPEQVEEGTGQQDDDFAASLDPALSEEEEHETWKDSEDDEDEVDQSLSVLSPVPKKAPAYNFSPVKTSSLPQFATPQPTSRTHCRRISMPQAGGAETKPSIRAALVRLQISGHGERIVHESFSQTEAGQEQQSSPTKPRKVVRVSDVGLPATELSMGFDVVQDSADVQESEKISVALDDLFTAEEEELTDSEFDDDDEEVEQEEEEEEKIVQISSKPVQSASRAPASVHPSWMQVPQTPAALNSVRHLFSSASAQPSSPDMHGLASMLNPSPEKQPEYGSLGDRMRAADPEIVELISPSKGSPRKFASSSPIKSRRGVRRSEAAELAVPLPVTPRAAPSVRSLPSPEVTPLPHTVIMPPSVGGTPVRPAVEAELHVTMFDAAEMDAQNEAIARSLAEVETEQLESAVATTEEDTLAEKMTAALEEHIVEQVIEEPIIEQAVEEPVPEDEREEAVAELAEPIQHIAAESATDSVEAPGHTEAEFEVLAIETSPTKRTSRRAASASPTKRTARSVSPTKRAARSSPVKCSAALVSAPEVFQEQSAAEPAQEEIPEKPAEEAVEAGSPTQSRIRSSPVKRSPTLETAEKISAEEPAAQEVEAPAEEAQEASRSEPESATKASRQAGGRKAKTVADEAISSGTVAESPEKRVRKARAAATKRVEGQPRAEEESAAEEAEAPKKATRTRTTRAAAVATRSTRTRAAKIAEPAVPSSSAGYGDDEASEAEEAVPVKTKRAARTKKTEEGESPTKAAAKATRKPAVRTVRSARAKAAEVSEAEDGVEQAPSEQEDEEEVPAKKTRARATRSAAAAKKTKAQLDAEDVATSSSATRAGTTRSGRPRRAAATK